MQHRIIRDISVTAVTGLAVFIMALNFWTAPLRLLLAHMPAGWAMYLVVMGGLLVGLGAITFLYWLDSPRKRHKLPNLVYAFLILILGLLNAGIVYITIGKFREALISPSSDLATLLGKAIFRACSCDVYAGLSLFPLRRLYRERITVRDVPNPD